MECLLCRADEIQLNPGTNRFVNPKHPQDVTGIICSDCVQLIISTSQEKLRAACQSALEKGSVDKARALKTFIEEGEHYVRETKTRDLERNLDRTRVVRKVRVAHQRSNRNQSPSG